MICQFCEYEFPDGLGKYGCPNCHGEGLSEDDTEACTCFHTEKDIEDQHDR